MPPAPQQFVSPDQTGVALFYVAPPQGENALAKALSGVMGVRNAYAQQAFTHYMQGMGGSTQALAMLERERARQVGQVHSSIRAMAARGGAGGVDPTRAFSTALPQLVSLLETGMQLEGDMAQLRVATDQQFMAQRDIGTKGRELLREFRDTARGLTAQMDEASRAGHVQRFQDAQRQIRRLTKGVMARAYQSMEPRAAEHLQNLLGEEAQGMDYPDTVVRDKMAEAVLSVATPIPVQSPSLNVPNISADMGLARDLIEQELSRAGGVQRPPDDITTPAGMAVPGFDDARFQSLRQAVLDSQAQEQGERGDLFRHIAGVRGGVREPRPAAPTVVPAAPPVTAADIQFTPASAIAADLMGPAPVFPDPLNTGAHLMGYENGPVPDGALRPQQRAAPPPVASPPVVSPQAQAPTQQGNVNVYGPFPGPGVFPEDPSSITEEELKAYEFSRQLLTDQQRIDEAIRRRQ